MESNLNAFLGQDNTGMLWGVLIDELKLKNNNAQLMTYIQTIFNTNLNMFRNKVNPNQSIMMLNKQFLQQVIAAINQLVPNFKHEQSLKSIHIGEDIKEPYKVEDIHASRQSDFEKQLAQKQQDFDNIINQKKPDPVIFSDNIKDEKISQMDVLISETIARRNFEVEQFQNNNYNTNINTNINTNSGITDPESWLKPQETNVSLQKIKPETILQHKSKYVNVNPLNAETNTNNTKKVSWDENNIYMDVDEISTININTTDTTSRNTTDIFLKLKRAPTETEILKQEIQMLKDQISKMNEKLDMFIERVTL